MKAAGRKNWASAACASLVAVLLGLGMAGCGAYGNNNASGVGCGLAASATPGPALIPGSEYQFLFVPNALCSPQVANDVMSVLVIGPDGSPNNGPVPLVQTGNQPVWAVVDPTNHFVYVTNELDNTVSAFTLNTATGAIGVVPGSPFPAGTAPGAAAVDPLGKFLYVANDGSSTVPGSISGYMINANGSLAPVPGSPFTTPATPLSPQQGIAVTAGFVYVSNSTLLGLPQASNSVSAFSFDNTGKLTPLAGSPFPLAPALNPEPESLTLATNAADQQFLFTANLASNNISAFTVSNGSLTQALGSPFGAGAGFTALASPQYLVSDPTGAFLYVVSVGNPGVTNGTVTTYTIAGNGALTQLGMPLTTGDDPEGLAVAVVGANKFLLVANCFDGDLSVYDINGDGTLTGLGSTNNNAIIACPQMVATTHLP